MLQKNDDDLKHIFKILETQPYEIFIMRNVFLFKYETGYELIVVPMAIEEEIIKSTHDNGHFGVKKIEQKIRQQYYIASLREKLQKCVRTCVLCILAENKYARDFSIRSTKERCHYKRTISITLGQWLQHVSCTSIYLLWLMHSPNLHGSIQPRRQTPRRCWKN